MRDELQIGVANTKKVFIGSFGKPPENFRDLSIQPTSKDVLNHREEVNKYVYNFYNRYFIIV